MMHQSEIDGTARCAIGCERAFVVVRLRKELACLLEE